MTATELARLVDEPETHRLIVGDYDRSYALGVSDFPPAFLLRVEPDDVANFPRWVRVHGEEIPVVVHGSFRQPKPV